MGRISVVGFVSRQVETWWSFCMRRVVIIESGISAIGCGGNGLRTAHAQRPPPHSRAVRSAIKSEGSLPRMRLKMRLKYDGSL